MSFDETRMRRAIEAKRDGEALGGEEWEQIVGGYLAGSIGEEQMAAMLMAALWRGLSTDETAALTDAMVRSGDVIAFPPEMFVVDKHSSGGVSDIVSLVAVPVASACGAYVGKLSGRALGHTGGTIDKLEAIPGVRTELSPEAFVAQVERVGCAIAAQSDRIVPADKRLYALRDRTATIPCIGLIAASIVSKKLAGGANAYVFDVKCGRGAFMHDRQQATSLACELVAVARHFGHRSRALVTDMEEPLGRCVGSGLEAIEARDFLRSGGGEDARVRDAILRVAAELLALGGTEDASKRVAAALSNGAGYEKFLAMIEAQGGSRRALESMRPASPERELRAVSSGYVRAIDAVAIGNAARDLSRREATAGVAVAVRIGDRIDRADLLARIYGSDADTPALDGAFTISETKPEPRPLVLADF
jgi:pyrimidine-nucleoside phosphorylase